MKNNMMKQSITMDSTATVLQEIQEQKQDMGIAHYHEFHKVTTERGFTKIVIPQTRRR